MTFTEGDVQVQICIHWPISCLGLLRTNTSNRSIAVLSPCICSPLGGTLGWIRERKTYKSHQASVLCKQVFGVEGLHFCAWIQLLQFQVVSGVIPQQGEGGWRISLLHSKFYHPAPDLPSIWSACSPGPKGFSSLQQHHQLGCWGTIISVLWQSL